MHSATRITGPGLGNNCFTSTRALVLFLVFDGVDDEWWCRPGVTAPECRAGADEVPNRPGQ